MLSIGFQVVNRYVNYSINISLHKRYKLEVIAHYFTVIKNNNENMK